MFDESHVFLGYADAHGIPTEDGVVADGYFMYNWIRQRSGDSPVYLWGHSLGSAYVIYSVYTL